ncbi:MAG: hypothetical protein GF370_02760 [Candidatus Nealsonbacteria bacterium]|nr:hypothetical protein [Candidatus Nealsonbacteria bacterium]
MKQNNLSEKAWIIDVNMGYGHQRTAYPLKEWAVDNTIIHANDYPDIPQKDRRLWERSRSFYEFISNFKRVPLVGNFAFSLYDRFQRILSFYPKRDLSKPTLTLRQFTSLFKKGWGKHLVDKAKEKPSLPFVSTFFIPAFMAEFFDYPGEIYCVVCDADISRAWVSEDPSHSRIKYFAPTERVVERLKLYGVRPENIFFTGYPLPKECLGTEKLEYLRKDLAQRLLILDPQKKYFERYQSLVNRYLGELPKESNRPFTIMFAVGGAGAQKELGGKILNSLRSNIKSKEIRVILVAGVKENVKDYFEQKIKTLGLENKMGDYVEIIFNQNIEEYFKEFNKALRKTDILWTKPSELSFYTALGLPIIIAPTIGSQEHFNKRWLLRLGSGMDQENPDYTNQWLFDLLKQGWFAEAAMEGFVESEKRGTFNIKDIIHQKQIKDEW